MCGNHMDIPENHEIYQSTATTTNVRMGYVRLSTGGIARQEDSAK